MTTIGGLPAHPLLVHLAVVAIPLAALLAIVAVVWPEARRWLGPITPAVALVALVITPLTTSTGESLAEQFAQPSPDLAKHMDLGSEMIAWVGPLFVSVALFWALNSTWLSPRISERLSPLMIRILWWVLAVIVLVSAIGSLVMVIRVGDLGARSVWGQ
ncbi:hypothetical protein ACWDTI_13280 [Gordonia sp. NPDC003424]